MGDEVRSPVRSKSTGIQTRGIHFDIHGKPPPGLGNRQRFSKVRSLVRGSKCELAAGGAQHSAQKSAQVALSEIEDAAADDIADSMRCYAGCYASRNA